MLINCNGSVTCEQQTSHVHSQSAKCLNRGPGNSSFHKWQKAKQHARLHLKPYFVFLSLQRSFSWSELLFEDRCEKKPQFFIIVLSQATFCRLWSFRRSSDWAEEQISGREGGRDGLYIYKYQDFVKKTDIFESLELQGAADLIVLPTNNIREDK